MGMFGNLAVVAGGLTGCATTADHAQAGQATEPAPIVRQADPADLNQSTGVNGDLHAAREEALAQNGAAQGGTETKTTQDPKPATDRTAVDQKVTQTGDAVKTFEVIVLDHGRKTDETVKDVLAKCTPEQRDSYIKRLDEHSAACAAQKDAAVKGASPDAELVTLRADGAAKELAAAKQASTELSKPAAAAEQKACDKDEIRHSSAPAWRAYDQQASDMKQIKESREALITKDVPTSVLKGRALKDVPYNEILEAVAKKSTDDVKTLIMYDQAIYLTNLEMQRTVDLIGRQETQLLQQNRLYDNQNRVMDAQERRLELEYAYRTKEQEAKIDLAYKSFAVNEYVTRANLDLRTEAQAHQIAIQQRQQTMREEGQRVGEAIAITKVLIGNVPVFGHPHGGPIIRLHR